MAIGSRHTPETIEKMRRSYQLRRLKRPEATAIKEGDMVICPDGDIGLLSEHRIVGSCAVQFGAGGPFKRYPWKTLRRATMKEIIDAGLHGVGCNQGYK